MDCNGVPSEVSAVTNGVVNADSIGFALFGAGRIGKVHLRHLYLNERVSLLYVVEEDMPRAQKLLVRFHLTDKVKVTNMEGVQQVFDDPRVKAALICTPSFTHEELTKRCLNAGKAVFCEKPLAPTIAAVKECYHLAKKQGLPLFCAFNRRYDPQVRKVYNLLQEGGVGKLRTLCVFSRDSPSMMTKAYLKASGGIYIDSVIHSLDLLCWLTGEKPVLVYAAGSATDSMYAECGDVDSTVVILHFPGGAIGTIETCRDAQIGFDQRLEILGTKGVLQAENFRLTEVIHSTLKGSVRDPIEADVCNRFTESYERELDHFLNVVQGSEELEVTAESTLTASMIAVACKKSLDTGLPVTMDYSM